MLGITDPAVLGAPANIRWLTLTFQARQLGRRAYSTAAAVAILMKVVTGALVLLSGACRGPQASRPCRTKHIPARVVELGPWRWPRWRWTLLIYPPVVVLPTIA